MNEIIATIEEDHYIAATWMKTGKNLCGIVTFLEKTKNRNERNGHFHLLDHWVGVHIQIIDRKTVMKRLV
ncbi:hypothetical protein [Flagellimonas aequoris]|uniref:Uncharacterized protein n=1 Tax=Flagellimonas aequoris TaxID=2306997 RepID=A0A418N7M7_9FLAO|nr:hypothetical protein [Allomuricauda aequoris]RIV71129.1 hypothetical protein D2U88_08350 [Allomuricauda aequoris]TXK02505.1 hypothetical protein FQ019_08280 [Allomuricauda aequoris]